MTHILGINAYHGDSAACLLTDGAIVAAAEEERFRRIKHWAGLPTEAIRFCLNTGGISPADLDHIAISRNPLTRLHKKIWFVLSHRPRLSTLEHRAANAGVVRSVKQTLCRELGISPSDLRAPIHFVEHHRAHMASAFLVSPFQDAAILSIDGFGDFASTMLGEGSESRVRVIDTVEFPHSLGVLYSAVTQYLGFLRYGDEYKVMGLAAYGQPTYREAFDRILKMHGNGTFELALEFFVHHVTGADMTWRGGEPVLGLLYSPMLVELLGPPRAHGEELQPRHADVAASLQVTLEDAYFKILNALHDRTGRRSLCLAGGVAFNSVANGKIFDRTPFQDVYIQAAAGDAGTALGAASYVWHQVLGKPRSFVMTHAYWGPEFRDGAIGDVLHGFGLPARSLDTEALLLETATAIVEGKVVGWFQGKMEWGPRALGNRSILVDPRRAEMKDVLNARIKRREPFRPFAPSILIEAVGEYFERTYPDPFMIKVYPVRPDKRTVIPAVTHVDGTGRLQTVSQTENPAYWGLIKTFGDLTGVPVLLNTSFNENEPIVCTPKEAIECFLRTRMDVLVLGHHLVYKA